LRIAPCGWWLIKLEAGDQIWSSAAVMPCVHSKSTQQATAALEKSGDPGEYAAPFRFVEPP
jgi:hypothetical protein